MAPLGSTSRFGALVVAGCCLVSTPARANGLPGVLDGGAAYTVAQPLGGGAEESGDQFGWSLAVGDFDADGRDDLAVGAPFEDQGDTQDAGAVFVFPGSPAGLAAGQFLFQDATATGVVAAQEYLGYGIAAGDFDGDGYDDLAAGAFAENGLRGAVAIWYGSADGIDPQARPGSFFAPDDLGCGPAEPFDEFGGALAAGDFDADGRDDLAIGVHKEDQGAGAVCVVRGTASGIAGGGALYYEDTNGYVAESPEPSDLFGYALATGRLSGGPNEDLAVGAFLEAPGAQPDGGAALVWFGRDGGTAGDLFSGGVLLTEGDAQPPNPIASGEAFGSSFATGDVDGDGIDELAVGAPSEAGYTGTVFLYPGLAGGPTTALWYTQGGFPGETGQTQEFFGHAIALGDLDGDGRAELVISAPREKGPGGIETSGMIGVIPGLPIEVSAKAYREETLLAGAVSEASEFFGWSLAIGDFDGDGRRELAIGAPGERVGAGVDAGIVYVAPEAGATAIGVGSLSALFALSARRRGGSVRAPRPRSRAS